MPFPRVTTFAHDLIRGRLRHGDRAIDATVGKGLDTRFLADCVGPSGWVDGFEIQSEAIAIARAQLVGYEQVEIHHLSHERIGEKVTLPVDAVMFNLGYLPTGDKSLITLASSTLPALDASLSLLSPRGILSVVVYPGHEGGDDEAAAVEQWFQSLDPSAYRVIHYGNYPPGAGKAPFLLAAERRN